MASLITYKIIACAFVSINLVTLVGSDREQTYSGTMYPAQLPSLTYITMITSNHSFMHKITQCSYMRSCDSIYNDVPLTLSFERIAYDDSYHKKRADEMTLQRCRVGSQSLRVLSSLCLEFKRRTLVVVVRVAR